MGVVRQESERQERVLKREAQLPLPQVGRHPMSVVGACLVFFFLAAMVDALLWQVSADREQLRVRAEAAEAAVVELEWQLSQVGLEGEGCAKSPATGAESPAEPVWEGGDWEAQSGAGGGGLGAWNDRANTRRAGW
jgi:hypothetical protein